MGARITSPLATRWLWAIADVAIVVVALFAAALLRFDFEPGEAFAPGVALAAAAAAIMHLLAGFTVGPYAVGHVRGSFEEIVDLAATVAVWTIVLFLVNLFVPAFIPRSVPISAGALALIGMFGVRFVLRAARHRGGHDDTTARRVLVYGAGEGGRQLVRALVRDSAPGLTPVGLLDDDPRKRRLRFDGVRVLGTRHDLTDVARRTEADVLAVAIPSASSEMLREVRNDAEETGLDVLVLPPASAILGRPKAADLRSLDLQDLLGRRPIELDKSKIAETIQGRVVLVTGAGGSIGAELCRQISHFGPAKLLMLDRDESALHAVQISVTGKGLLDDDSVVLADIRDADRLYEVFDQHRPAVVFHAAALKHLPLLERYPLEAWKTNVLGTLNVLEAAYRSGVQTFVNISTDKAANPSCVLGYSKRLTERLTAHYAAKDENTYVSVRFGNVLGSRGSVITAFTSQIELGGPVTVTHPDVERFFMLIPEACQLVLQASAIGADGEVMVLDMGQPAKIDEVARTLIGLSGRDIGITYTGLRPGEKMSEELFAPGEAIRTTAHPLVSSVGVPSMHRSELPQELFQDDEVATAWMRERAHTPGEGAA